MTVKELIEVLNNLSVEDEDKKVCFSSSYIDSPKEITRVRTGIIESDDLPEEDEDIIILSD